MEFNESKAIYLQIADFICENILNHHWKSDEKIPSVRQLAIEIEVNPNTTMRTYSYLQEHEIIYNKRGIGYFVHPKGEENAIELIKSSFIETEVPPFFRKIKMLNIPLEKIQEWYNKF